MGVVVFEQWEERFDGVLGSDVANRLHRLEAKLGVIRVELFVQVIQPSLVGRFAHRVHGRDTNPAVVMDIGVADEFSNPRKAACAERFQRGCPRDDRFVLVFNGGPKGVYDSITFARRDSIKLAEDHELAKGGGSRGAHISSESPRRADDRASAISRPGDSQSASAARRRISAMGSLRATFARAVNSRSTLSSHSSSRTSHHGESRLVGDFEPSGLELVRIIAADIGEQGEAGRSNGVPGNQPIEEDREFARTGSGHRIEVSLGSHRAVEEHVHGLRDGTLARDHARDLGGDWQLHVRTDGELQSHTSGGSAFDGFAHGCKGSLHGGPAAQQLAKAPVAAERGEAGRSEVSNTGQTLKGEGIRAHGDAETRHFGESAGHDGGDGVGAEFASPRCPCRNCHDVLERTGQLHAHNVVRGVGAKFASGKRLLPGRRGSCVGGSNDGRSR